MKASITPNQIRETNKNAIYRFIYENGKASQQDICYELHLSRPTVMTNLNELEDEGLIEKNGQMDTAYVGRKAAAYAIAAQYRVGIGVEILKKEIKIIAVDLYGRKIDRLVYNITYKEEETYFRMVCEKITAFVQAHDLQEEQILGIGFAMQALVEPDGQTILYGKILDCTGLSIQRFADHLPYPCAFLHDADCAAVSELWVTREMKDAFYLSLSNHLGAAIIRDGQILAGKHGHNSTIEHIPMIENGKKCYCGRQGCMETLVSLEALLEEGESVDEFFRHVRMEDSGALSRWREYLTQLARAVNILHLVHDTDFILGGYLAPYLTQEDIAFLHEQIDGMTPFSEAADFIHRSNMPKHNITIGAALTYIKAFLESRGM